MIQLYIFIHFIYGIFNRNIHIKEVPMWIWQSSRYPEFTYDHATLNPILEQLAFNRGTLLAITHILDKEEASSFQAETITSDAVSTFMIEGEVLSRDSVRSSVRRRLGLENTIPQKRDDLVDNTVSILIDAVSNSDFSNLESRIFGYHAAFFPTGYSGFYKINTGAYRTDEMEVISQRGQKEKVHYVAPLPDVVPDEMKRFYAWMTSIDASAIHTAIAHLWFLIIHPFDDGNGRLARVISDMMCAKKDRTSTRLYSISEAILKHKGDYYDILERTTGFRVSPGKDIMDITEWVNWFTKITNDAIVCSIHMVEGIIEKKRFIEEHFKKPINARQRKVLLKVLDFGPGFEGFVTTSKYKSIASTSQATAVRDIREMEDLGILEKVPGKGGRSTSYRLLTPDSTNTALRDCSF